MKLFNGIFTLIVGLLISAVAGYFSIVGLAALFAAGGMSILLMGASLEVGKLTAASWLKIHWADKTVSWIHKSYLMIAVAALMVITSIGIYGYLAAGHLEQKAPLAGISIQSEQLESRLAQYQNENERLMSRLNQIDQNINSFITQGAASRGLSASQSLRQERDRISTKIEENNTQINTLNDQLVPLKTQNSTVEAKLGPVKYLAQLIGYGDSPETAVQLVILLIMIPFDPLAVVLVLSGMISINQWRTERRNGVAITIEAAEEPKQTDPAPAHMTPIEFQMVQSIPIECAAEAVASEPEPEPEPEQEPEEDKREERVSEDKRTISREEILDLLEENPTFVNEMISAIMGTIQTKKTTPTDITGGRVDD